MPITGVLLTGGRSVRMGRDKAALQFGGEPLGVRVLRVLRDACDEVLVASGDGTRLGWLGVPQVADAIAGAGPLAGIVSGLEGASYDTVAVVAVDMPFASPALLRLLAELRTDEEAVVPLTEHGPEPLHAVYSRDAAAPLRNVLESGERAVHRALGSLRVREVGPEEWRQADPAGRFAINLNRPGDLHASEESGSTP